MDSIFEVTEVGVVEERYLIDYGYVLLCECGQFITLVQRSETKTRRIGASVRVTEVALHCYAGTCAACSRWYRTPIKRYEADPSGRLQLVGDGDNGSESEDDDDATTSEIDRIAGGVASAG